MVNSRKAGLIGFAAGVLGVVAHVVLAVYPAAVDESRYSYPFTTTGFIIAQIVGYALATLVIGVSGILAGIAVLRAKAWSGPQRRLPLALGIYVFVPLTPAIGGPFVVDQVAIAGWMMLYAVLGWSVVWQDQGRPYSERKSARVSR